MSRAGEKRRLEVGFLDIRQKLGRRKTPQWSPDRLKGLRAVHCEKLRLASVHFARRGNYGRAETTVDTTSSVQREIFSRSQLESTARKRSARPNHFAMINLSPEGGKALNIRFRPAEIPLTDLKTIREWIVR
ncbi:hypothetical protein KM043_016365 [Ampulex compressa]|nr:hypothetical protein KM043_016365 [Ampulex compressa]